MKRLTCLILGALLIWMLVSCGTLPPAEPTATSIPASPTPGPSSVPSESQQRPETEWHLVVIGDSSLGGLGKAFASQMENDVGVQVVLHNHVFGQ